MVAHEGVDGTDVYTSDPMVVLGHSMAGGGMVTLAYLDHFGNGVCLLCPQWHKRVSCGLVCRLEPGW